MQDFFTVVMGLVGIALVLGMCAVLTIAESRDTWQPYHRRRDR